MEPVYKTATCRAVKNDLNGDLPITEVDCNILVLFGAREAGCFREVTALHTEHLRQVAQVHGE